MKSYPFLVLLFTLLALVSSAPSSNGKPLIPQEDSFYDDPEDLQSYALGELIKIRKTPHQLRGIYIPISVKDSWQIMVRSSDVFGNATAIVSTIIEPFNADPSKLVTYNIAEDASAENCAPSYSLQYGANMDTLIAQIEMYFIQMALNEGWWVLVPDYEGKNSAFTAGRKAGKSVLDSIRGALNSVDFTGLDADPDIVMWGYSGGSIATGWAAALQPTYAPELGSKLRGAAVGGFAANISETILVCDNTLYAGLIPNGMWGLSREYPELEAIVESYMNTDRIPRFKHIAGLCLVPSIVESLYATLFSGAPSDQLWFPDGWNVFNDEKVKDILLNTTLAIDETEMPQIPFFVYHGLDDHIVPSSNTFRVYDIWSKAGIKSMEVSISNSTRHITEMLLGCPAAVTWLKKAFNNDTVDGTQFTYRSSNLDYPDVEPQIIDLIFGAGRTILDTNLGPIVSPDGTFISSLTSTQGKGNDTITDNPTINKRGFEDFDQLLEMHLHDMYLNKKKRNGMF
ncbi:putative lipase 5 [[Candida] railenensis]|uniref:Lipase 5 n=1 Tax=[Candida] railenensis TaxID=45579 RepID=A0A9P0VYQ8_9ASCO|nr:putative lipase 5 [[Candida] railenensis]